MFRLLLKRPGNGALVIIGDVDGEKNCCWKGPAEASMESLSRLNVSRENGISPCPCCVAPVWAVVVLSREYSWRSESGSSSFGLPALLLTAGAWGEKSAGRFRLAYCIVSVGTDKVDRCAAAELRHGHHLAF